MYSYFTGNECLVKSGVFSLQKTPTGFWGFIGGKEVSVVFDGDSVRVTGNGKSPTYYRVDQDDNLPQATPGFVITQYSAPCTPTPTNTLPTSRLTPEIMSTANARMAYLLATLGVVIPATLGMQAGEVGTMSTTKVVRTKMATMATALPDGPAPLPTPPKINWCKEYNRQMTLWLEAYWAAILWLFLFGCIPQNQSEVCEVQRAFVQRCSDEIDTLAANILIHCRGGRGEYT